MALLTSPQPATVAEFRAVVLGVEVSSAALAAAITVGPARIVGGRAPDPGPPRRLPAVKFFVPIMSAT
jgi:hypothetical protein